MLIFHQLLLLCPKRQIFIKSPNQDQDTWKATGNLYLHPLSYSFGDKGSHSTYKSTIISCNTLLIASLSENSSRICLIKFSHQLSHGMCPAHKIRAVHIFHSLNRKHAPFQICRRSPHPFCSLQHLWSPYIMNKIWLPAYALLCLGH